MDILGEYERQTPARPVMAAQPLSSSGSEYGFLIRLVMRLSGGKIDNARQANMVLLVVGCMILLASGFIFIRTGGSHSSGPVNGTMPIAGPSDPRFQPQ